MDGRVGTIVAEVNSSVAASELEIPLVLPPRGVEKIANLQGELAVLMPGRVETFTFDGVTRTDTGTNVVDGNGDPTGDVDNNTTTTEGTTVQLPTFSFTTVSTTVSVPDGGTILLGGIKRLREGRNEHGVPMLSKIPYVNRLFKNTGTFRPYKNKILLVIRATADPVER